MYDSPDTLLYYRQHAPSAALFITDDRLREGTARAEDAQGTPAQSHISPSILVYEEKHLNYDSPE